ncbi:MAG: class I SAM-dependent methyltransferase [Gammaproteobacteria bacterium]|nr:class I SAM-dependent methyltransferase [Gammaproteobacteria bacterium]
MDRKSHWDNTYASKPIEEVSWFQQEPTISFELITKENLSTEATIIDVGGGASHLSQLLFDAGYQKLTVLDISAIALNHAQDSFGELSSKIEWIESDITEFSPPHPYCVWHDRAVFHFLTEAEDRARYVEILNNSLTVGGYLIIAAFAIGGPDKCSGLDIMQHDLETLNQQLGEDYRLLEQRSELHTTPDGSEQQFNYFRFIRER